MQTAVERRCDCFERRHVFSAQAWHLGEGHAYLLGEVLACHGPRTVDKRRAARETMFFYFGYGSNMSLVSLRAKGVEPVESEPATLEGWRLCFNVPDFFRIEGGTGNIETADGEVVHGVLHKCHDHDLVALDHLEALGVSYERRVAEVTTYSGRRVQAFVYVGIGSKVAPEGLPSERYRNILVQGAEHMRLAPAYIDRLRSLPVCSKPQNPPFEVSGALQETFTLARLAASPSYVGFAGLVFDMSNARPEHAYIKKLLGGTDATLLFLKRMDSSSGDEVYDDVTCDRLTPRQKQYLNDYLHEFNREYVLVGKLVYDDEGMPQKVANLGAGELGEIAARRVLREAEERNRAVGHENLGFLSETYGFMPATAPALTLASSLHRQWDEIAGDLPAMYRDLNVRRRIEQLDVLPADAEHLPEHDLLRASAILAMLAHSYWYVESRPPEQLPAAIKTPWDEVRRRLDRGPQVLSYVDLVVYNWRLRDPAAADPRSLGNMRLLIPTVDTAEERIFYLTQAEILARCSPVIGAVVRGQEAAVRDDRDGLEAALLTIIGSLQRVVRESLLHINPCPASPEYVDPVVWAKTVAPFAVPMESGVQGPSGTSSPIFNLLDLFFGRTKYQTFLGREIKQLRQVYPQHWQQFLKAVQEVSIADHVRRIESRSLSGLLQEAIELYAGENGFLGRHRMKVYGYLEIAFKVGRSITIGGFSGMFEDRTWDQVDSELEYSRIERFETFPKVSHLAYVKSVGPADTAYPDEVRHVVLDVSECGIRYEAGDRCGILAESEPALVEKTIAALHATGDEEIVLTPEWREAVRLRAGHEHRESLSLREVLTFGRIRPVTLRLAEALHAASQNDTLKEAILEQTTTRWELWDLLALLGAGGFDPTRLWRAGVDSSEHLCRVLPPETFRIYSIASTMKPGEASASELHLMIGRILYDTPDAEGPVRRRGSASNFLADAAARKRPITFILRHPPRFGLPEDPSVPIVMLAGGTGFAPFRSFLLERSKHPNAGPAILFWSLRSREYFYFADDLKPALAAGTLDLRVAFSRDDVRVSYEPDDHDDHQDLGRFVFEPAPRQHVQDVLLEDANAELLWSLIRSRDQGGQGAHLYICGRSQFAKSVDKSLSAVVERFVDGPESQRHARAQAVIERLIAEGRYNHEVFTDARAWNEPREEYDVSEIVRHNDEQSGWWMVIDGVVYDLSQFIRRHPGGARVLAGYAGLDATQGYLRAHAGRSEVDAMRELYEIGTVRRPEFRGICRQVTTSSGTKTVALAALYQSWVSLLYLLVEMQNALRHDQSLQSLVTTRGTDPADRTCYKLQRAVETHERFLQCYLAGVAEELGRLGELTAGLCASSGEMQSERGSDLLWMTAHVEELLTGPEARREWALCQILHDAVHELAAEDSRPDTSNNPLHGRLVALCGVIEAEDARFLSEMKGVIREGVIAFEELEHQTLEHGAHRLIGCCRETVTVIESYYERVLDAARHAGWSIADSGDDAEPSGLYQMRHVTTTVIATAYWLMEEDAERCVVFLRRSPVPVTDLDDLVAQNELIISKLRPEYMQWGVVADMRQTAGRNDPAFENAMRRLRQVLSESFARLAVLLASAVGVLQVNRIGRNEGNTTFATQSEHAALRFAMGEISGS